jgi:acetylornithine/succinyldiaminopimelate/putrescine aminotransferase
MGEACATAIEALHTLYDDGLIDNAAEQGAYLKERLESLKNKYPGLIADVRGRGLMVGLEMTNVSRNMPRGFRAIVSMLDQRLRGGLAAIVGSLLLHEYDVLVAFTEYDRNVIRLEPPLIIERTHVDQLADSIDDLLSRDFVRISMDYLRKVKLANGYRQLIGGAA